MSEILTIPQNRYAILSKDCNYSGFVTRAILSCTAIFGINRNTGVIFLVHIDVFWSANEFPKIIDEAIRLSNGDAHFELEVINGHLLTTLILGNPLFTRRKIFKYLQKYPEVKIVKDHGFSFVSIRRDVEFERSNGVLLVRKNCERSDKDKRKPGKLRVVEH